MGRLTPVFADYYNAYENIALEREDGVLTIRLHTSGGSLIWSAQAEEELAYCFADVAADRENHVVIITGTGANYCADIDGGSFVVGNPTEWDHTVYLGRKLLMNLLDIEVPVIAAVNGPAMFHGEIPALSDIVVLSETATFQDASHFVSGIVPGDGAHIAWPLVLGPNRGRYFLLTGEVLDAPTALSYGLANEVVAANQVLERAKVLARSIAERPFLTRRYSRLALVQPIKMAFTERLASGLLSEALAAVDNTDALAALK